ncbi:MAG: hypothetical protein IKQ95_05420 [Synergistaceae bacterium]|nr:hypothetical protein [Synergistaceae bacterium]
MITIMYTYSFELDETDKNFLEAYAEETGESIGEMAKRFMLEHVEDVMDAREADKALAEYLANPVSYRLNEVINEINENLVYNSEEMQRS